MSAEGDSQAWFFAQILKWADELSRSGVHTTLEMNRYEENGHMAGEAHLRFETSRAQYAIAAKSLMPEDPLGYLGCTVNALDVEGSDLAAGSFDALTWHDILADIVGYEMWMATHLARDGDWRRP